MCGSQDELRCSENTSVYKPPISRLLFPMWISAPAQVREHPGPWLPAGEAPGTPSGTRPIFLRYTSDLEAASHVALLLALCLLHALLGPKYPDDANWMTWGLLILHINETRTMLWTFSFPLIRPRKIRSPFYAANDTY